MADVYVAREEGGNLALAHACEGLSNGMKDVGEGPGLNVGVVGSNRNVRKNSKDPEVLPVLSASHGIHNKGGAVVTLGSAKTPRGPLNPKQGNSENQKADEVGNHEGSTAILYRLNRETKEVAQAYGVSCHGKNEAYTGTPGLCVATHDLWELSNIGIRFNTSENECGLNPKSRRALLMSSPVMGGRFAA